MLAFPHPLPPIPMSAQCSFLSLAHQKKLRCEKFLSEMDRVMPWEEFARSVEPYYPEHDLGRKRKELRMMLKILCLEQWYTLSDPAMEDAIYDRCSFQKFLGIDLLSDVVPDETTICRFRHLLEEHGLQEAFFAMVRGLLLERGILVKEGTIVDATIVPAPSSTKNASKRRDPEMSSTKKGEKWFFGMKAHVGSDVRGFVHTLLGTTAKVHDSVVFPHLLHGEETAIFGDKAYAKDEHKRQARAAGVYWGVTDRARRGQGLSSAQRKRNRQTSAVRSFVEHPFGVLKCRWKYAKVRYRGLRKNIAHLHLLFALTNLYRARRILLAPVMT